MTTRFGILIVAACLALHRASADIAVFISEYGEGSGENKWIEIFNNTGAAIAMENYQLWILNRGTGTTGSWSEVDHVIGNMTGSVADAGVFLVVRSGADATLTEKADLLTTTLYYVNGNDSIALVQTNAGSGWVFLDAVGAEGPDPGNGWDVAGVNDATQDHTLVRKDAVNTGTTNWPASAGTDTNNSEWIVHGKDTFTYAGYHRDAPQEPPTLLVDLPVTGIFVTVGDTLTFNVGATDVNADPVTLQATGAPLSADFDPNPLVGTPPLLNTFSWTPSGPGTWSVTFRAWDNDGTNSTIIALEAMPRYEGKVWINEIHYGDVGVGTNEMYEGFEIAGRAGTDLAPYLLTLYNGSTLQVYNGPTALSGSIDDEGGYGAVWFPYAPASVQNGPADGVALVESAGGKTNVLQFLSYEGTLIAADGPAAGWLSTDIGVAQSESTPTNLTLQLTGKGSNPTAFDWTGPVEESKGRLNDGQTLVRQATYIFLH
jgi:hypothetical protein